MREVTASVRAGAADGALLHFCHAGLSTAEGRKAEKARQRQASPDVLVERQGTSREERLPSWNLARAVVEALWAEGKITGRARNALAALFRENEDLTLEQLRERIVSGKLREAAGIGAATFEEVRDIFV